MLNKPDVTLTQQVKTEARRLGFALVGITSSDPPPHWHTFDRWLSQGRHGQMEYLATERGRQCRQDPRRILPDCRSILVLAARYPAPQPAWQTRPEAASKPAAPRGRVAAYAWGRDYHRTFPERLRSLAAFIEARAGHPVPSRGYTDTGPVLERDLAQRAGLGWIGKNTCLINPRGGSYYLLSEILLGIELESDAPFPADRCGTCTRCIDACPTNCILPDRTLDARRCISYLTIELKEAVPPELRSPMGNWIFGCDVCQEVCPWNRFAEAEYDPAFTPRPDAVLPVLTSEMALTPGSFSRKFKDSPVRRARRRGYLRNVAVAAGNSGDPALSRALEHLAQDDEELVQEHARWALEQTRKGRSPNPPP